MQKHNQTFDEKVQNTIHKIWAVLKQKQVKKVFKHFTNDSKQYIKKDDIVQNSTKEIVHLKYKFSATYTFLRRNLEVGRGQLRYNLAHQSVYHCGPQTDREEVWQHSKTTSV